MNRRLIHVSDLHKGTDWSPVVDDALVALVGELAPELVVVTGDVSNRGRRPELQAARALVDRLPASALTVPGNHDIPYTVPARLTTPWAEFERALGPTDPTHVSESLVVCGLNSVRPWRHQGGRLSPGRIARVATAFGEAPPGALRVVALHHHLAGAPWRASRKLPLKHRDSVVSSFAAAGVELVLGGHIHQSSAVERHEFTAADGMPGASLVLATAPGLGRPRPRRTGEAQGLHVVEWNEDSFELETRIWDGRGFRPTARRAFPRRGLSPQIGNPQKQIPDRA